MKVWKEKVAEKLSRLLADSPSTDGVFPEAISSAGKEQPSAASYSSYVFSVLEKASASVGKVIPKKSENCRDSNPLPIPSLSTDWEKWNFSYMGNAEFTNVDKERESDDGIQIGKKKRGFISQQNMEASTAPEEDFSSYNSDSFISVLLHDSSLISLDLFEFLQASLPNMIKGCQWVLLYSTVKHGISLRTLLRNSADYQGSCVLIVGDKQGAVFGGFLDSSPKPTAKRKYQGTNQMFVFTTLYGEPRIFRPTGVNRYYYMCLNDLLAFGGGGNYALCLEDDLLHGTSGCSETYGNLPLAHNPEFELKNVELWGFTYMARYIS